MKVVMLTTEKAITGQYINKCDRYPSQLTYNYFDYERNQLKLSQQSTEVLAYIKDCCKPQHIYITDDSEIKDLDAIDKSIPLLFISSNDMIKVVTYSNQRVKTPGSYFKVIATTNPELWYKNTSADSNKYNGAGTGIAELSQDFIQAYIREYNAGKPITKVDVEMEIDIHKQSKLDMMASRAGESFSKPTQFKPKLRPDGTIITYPIVEQTFTKEDMQKAFHAGATQWADDNIPEDYTYTIDSANDWLSEKYPNK